MKRLLTTIVLFLVCCAANAEWRFVSTDDTGDKYYADPATKKRTGNIVRIWTLVDYVKKPLVSHGIAAHSIRGYMQFDCNERSSLLLDMTAFNGNMGKGEIVLSGPMPADRAKEFVAPGTNGNTMLNFACKFTF